MKKNFKNSAAALICLMIMTSGLTGCGGASEKKVSSDSPDSSAESSIVSETSEDNITEKSSDSSAESRAVSETSKDNIPENSSESSSESHIVSETSENNTQESSSESSNEPVSSDTVSQVSSEVSVRESSEESESDFTYSKDSSGNVILTGYKGKETAPVLPSVIYGKRVTAIGESCFAGNTAVKKLVIPEGVTEIGNYAFECCSNLKDITLPDSLRTIGEGAFSGCAKLSVIALNDGVDTIKKGAFLFCSSLKSVELPSELRELGRFAFSNCSGLTSVTFRGNKSISLPDRLFYSCEALSEVNINHALTSIGKRAFAHCESLNSISVPGEMDRIDDQAFYSCSSLTKVSVKADSTAENAFEGCYQLPEEMRPAPHYETIINDPGTDSSEEMSKPGTLGSIAGAGSLFDEEKYSSYRVIRNDEFSEWSKKYVGFCKENGIPTERDELLYTMLYKGEIIPHYMGMTSAENHDPAMSKQAAIAFGVDYEETYLMMNHGLYTELKRGRMCDDLVLYSGVYDSQLKAAAGTNEVPTLEQLKNSIGKTFTDPIMISTTTDVGVACNFSDTLFIIYASRESIDSLGAISIDSILGTNEKEILMSRNASYRILDVGTMAVNTTDYDVEEKEFYKNYVKLELL